MHILIKRIIPPTLFAVIFSLGIGTALAVDSETSSADVSILASTVTISAPLAADVKLMQVEIMAPDGRMALSETNQNGHLTWSPDGDDPDGSYNYEITIVTKDPNVATDSEEDSGQVSRRSGTIRVSNGLVFDPVADQAEKDTADEAAQRASEQQSSLLKQDTDSKFATRVLDILFSSAYAADLTASDATPQVDFQDTSPATCGGLFQPACVTGIQLEAVNNSNSSTTGQFYMQEGTGSTFFHYNSANDINLLGGDFYFDTSPIRMGIGTTAPSQELDIQGNDPSIELRDLSGVTWVLNNNNQSAEFDITHNGTVALEMNTSGRTGIYDTNPEAPLHVSSIDNKSAKILVENSVAPTAPGDVVMYELKNTGPKIVRFFITANGDKSWSFDNDPNFNGGAGAKSGKFRIAKSGTGIEEFSVDGFGNGRFAGIAYATQHINTSSREAKHDFKVVNEQEILEKLAALPVTTWKYKSEDSPLEHIGPMAEEFQRVFGLGDGKHISTVDTSGIAFAAIKGLDKKNSDLDKALNAKVESLETRNQALEASLSKKHAQLDALLERVTSLEQRIENDNSVHTIAY